jgi:glycyl-tRNA synthetase beta chain
MTEFLFEIGLEEVPARMIASAQAELQRRVVALLERERLIIVDTASKSFATPRRLAVRVQDVAAMQEDISEEAIGPSTKIAFKDGQPMPAAVAFAKKSGVAVEELRTIANAKGEYLVATSVKKGRSAAEVIAAELPKELAAIYWAKNMYWRKGKPERFVRPVRWMVALLDEAVIPISFAGYTASNLTYGHRVLNGPEAIEIAKPGAYEDALLKAHVMADVELRRHTIRKALDRVCRGIENARWREDHALVDKLTHLTEWPSVIAGSFDPEFLALPEEVLVTVMRDHQSYFAVEDKAGKLAPHFLAVLNTTASSEGEATIRHGNERVLRARFNDARFFWEFDQRVSLTDRVELLKNVTFQKDLGSYAAKTTRVRKLAQRLAGIVLPRGCTLNPVALDEAASLAKADLTCELVKEFTELQGIVGGLYARAQGVQESAAAAIYDQYLPASMEDRIPKTVEGCVLGIADRADTIAGMFSLGLEPTGSKDPFALRRAANAIVKILAEAEPAMPLTLGDVADAATGDEALRTKLEVFFAERLEFYLREAKQQAYDVVKAVLAAGANDVRDAIARAEAVTAMRGSEDFAAVCAAFKRMKNILAQAKSELPVGDEGGHGSAHPAHPAQLALMLTEEAVADRVKAMAEERDYVGALESVAAMRPQIDAFFDQVMVMDPNLSLRAQRLGLLMKIVRNFSGIADFSEIVTAG